MDIRSRIALTLGIILSLSFFQNCGEMRSGMSSNSSANNSTSNGAPAEETNTDFFQGDPFDVAMLPFELTDQAAIDAAAAYPDITGYKAMAFTERGDLYIANNNSNLIEGQDDWNQAVLERCQLFFMNQPCSLFAAGDVIAQDKANFLVGFNSVITVPAQFDGNLVPGGINYWQNHHQTTYPDFSNNPFKAFAIGPTGAASPGWSQVSQAEATRRAMEFCEAISDRPCTLYAEGLDVVFDLETYQWGPKLLQWGPRPFNVDEIPFVPEAVRETIRTQYNQGLFFALALDKFGFWETIRSTAPIGQADLDTILAGCNAKLPAPVPGGSPRQCFIYSIDDQVVVTRQDYTMATYGY